MFKQGLEVLRLPYFPLRTIELVPGPWLVLTSMGLFGLMWSSSSFYSILLSLLLGSWRERLFWNGVAVLGIVALMEVLSAGEKEKEKRGRYGISHLLVNCIPKSTAINWKKKYFLALEADIFSQHLLNSIQASQERDPL